MTNAQLKNQIASGYVLPIFKFTAYNSESFLGFGSESEADAFCDCLNADREINLYAAYEITDGEEFSMANSCPSLVNLED